MLNNIQITKKYEVKQPLSFFSNNKSQELKDTFANSFCFVIPYPIKSECSYITEYKSVLKNGFLFDGGYVVDAYYYPNQKEIWFILNDINFALRRNFSKKARLTWKSYCREVIPIITSKERFQKDLMPHGGIQLKVGMVNANDSRT